MSASTLPGKRIAIAQSNYIPWKGYFDLLNAVDECVLYDDAQYTCRDWRNRNRIKTFQGPRWLTIPVVTSGRRLQRIRDVEISDPSWTRRHWEGLRRNYRKAPCFTQYADQLAALYDQRYTSLSDANRCFLEALCSMLDIHTTISSSADYELADGPTERLVGICRQAGASHYLSGPAARAYLDESQFAAAGITVSYMDYSGYPEYPQLHGPFEHAVSVLDLVFSVGAEAPRFMKTVGVRL